LKCRPHVQVEDLTVPNWYQEAWSTWVN